MKEMTLRAGESFRNEPGTVHQMEAVTDCDLLEASTPHLDDVVRLKRPVWQGGTSAPLRAVTAGAHARMNLA